MTQSKGVKPTPTDTHTQSLTPSLCKRIAFNVSHLVHCYSTHSEYIVDTWVLISINTEHLTHPSPCNFFKSFFFFFQNQFSQSSINWYFKPINIEKMIKLPHFSPLRPPHPPQHFNSPHFKVLNKDPNYVNMSTLHKLQYMPININNKYQPCLEIKLLVWWYWRHLKLYYESILYLTSLLNWSMYIILSNTCTIVKTP